MKKFLIKVLVYIFCVGLLITAINEWYKSNGTDSDNTRKFQSVPENIQICNLGSSHGLYGFCYEDFETCYIEMSNKCVC